MVKRGVYILFKCCGEHHKGRFIYRLHKPVYRLLEYGFCPVCGTAHFVDYKQILENEDNFKEKLKTFKGNAATKEYDKWQNILNNQQQGTFAKQFFYYGEFQRSKNGYFKTYRKNFNNEKEFLFKDKIKIIII